MKYWMLLIFLTLGLFDLGIAVNLWRISHIAAICTGIAGPLTWIVGVLVFWVFDDLRPPTQ